MTRLTLGRADDRAERTAATDEAGRSGQDERVSRTLVCFHAHPDDEALFTAGTMAKAAAQGHRVVLVVATDGGQGLAATEMGHGAELATRRMAELQASADALGVARVVHLGYADSGLDGPIPPDPPGSQRFCRADVDQAAQRLAQVLRQERADVVTTYDEVGGYGHRDHVRVHQVGALAAELAGTPRVLEATIPRDLIAGAVRWLAKVHRFPPEFDPTAFGRAFVPASAITHTIDVFDHAGAKRAAMAAHVSQATADDGDRTLAAFLRLPKPVFSMVFSREWYVQSRGPVVPPRGRWWPRAPAAAGDIFAGLPAQAPE
ncbi:MAG: PIG-L family deacetylase [Austwickia sp.]|nr:PIG-L family deacetylase [Austwickia sp.]